jgi:hypothetical protein
VDFWALYDNNTCPTLRIASGWKKGERMEISEVERFKELKEMYGESETSDEKKETKK